MESLEKIEKQFEDVFFSDDRFRFIWFVVDIFNICNCNCKILILNFEQFIFIGEDTLSVGGGGGSNMMLLALNAETNFN